MKKAEQYYLEESTMKRYVIDAFTDILFHGKQAAVCVLDEWTPDKLMMDNTKENNYLEAAYLVHSTERAHHL